jgi:hypothetical protein
MKPKVAVPPGAKVTRAEELLIPGGWAGKSLQATEARTARIQGYAFIVSF